MFGGTLMAYRVVASGWASLKASLWPGLKTVAWALTAFLLWVAAIVGPLGLVLFAVSCFTDALLTDSDAFRSLPIYDRLLLLGGQIGGAALGLSYALFYRRRRDDWTVRRIYMVLVWLALPFLGQIVQVRCLEREIAGITPVAVTVRLHDEETGARLNSVGVKGLQGAGSERRYPRAVAEGGRADSMQVLFLAIRPFELTVDSEGYAARQVEIDPHHGLVEIDVGLSREPDHRAGPAGAPAR
jgi:hypothetical protein